MNGVSYITVSNFSTSFVPINNAIGLPNIAGTNALNYLDEKNAKGRRVDLNYNPFNIANDTALDNITRATLQSLLWSSRRINSLDNSITNTVYTTAVFVPGINYTGSLAGVNAKLLIIYQETQNTSIVPAMNSIIQALGGTVGTYSGSTGIFVNSVGLNTNDIASVSYGSNTVAGYDSSYDSVLYWVNNAAGPNTVSVLNRYHDNNKGVVLCHSSFDSSSGISLSKNLTVSGVLNGDGAQANSINSSLQTTTSMLYGVSSVKTNVSSQSFVVRSGSGASSIGSVSNTNFINYLDNSQGLGRRVDMNMRLSTGGTTESSTSGLTRATLQALLWSGRKFTNAN